jgi:hypothetical protein
MSDVVTAARTDARALSTTGIWTSARVVLPIVVALSFLARILAISGHRTPRLFPDEYIYATLARSISHGSLTIRGEPAHFPALLEPLLAAPFAALSNDPWISYRLTQGMHAVAMSLVAVPVYFLARRVRLPEWQSLICSAFAVTLPALLYSAYVSADAIGYLAATVALTAGVSCLDKPTWRGQAAFLALAGLAALARVQYVVLPVAFIAAAVIVEGGPRSALSRYRLTFTCLAVSAVAGAAAGPSRALGYYQSILDKHPSPLALLHWIATDAFLLALASGVVLAPAAAIGLFGGLRRSASRCERAFAALVVSFGVVLFAEAALYATTTERFQERYLMALLPLVPVAACIGWRRLPRGRLALALIAAAIVVAVARVPLSGYTVLTNRQDSPFLFAVAEIEHYLGYGSGAFAVSVASAMLAATAGLAALRPRPFAPVVLALALTACATCSVAAVASDRRADRAARSTLPIDPQWIDEARVGTVDVVVTPGTARSQVSNELFWNTSLARLIQLPGSQEVDAFGSTSGRIDEDGTLSVAGRPERRAFLLEEYGSSAVVLGATRVGTEPGASLWTPRGHVRFAVLTVGRYLDGWLADRATITTWTPTATGIRLRMSLPATAPQPQTIEVTGTATPMTLRLTPGDSRVVVLPLPPRRPARVTLLSERPLYLPDGRLVSVVSTRPKPVVTRGKGSCAACR